MPGSDRTDRTDGPAHPSSMLGELERLRAQARRQTARLLATIARLKEVHQAVDEHRQRRNATGMPYSIAFHATDDGIVRLALIGEFDLASATALMQAIDDAVERRNAAEILLDLDRTTFVDCATVNIIVAAQRKAQAVGRSLSVVDPREPVCTVLSMTGVLDTLRR
jgi:anti-anti-sigma factor